MQELPMIGKIRFSDIGTVFSDPYSLTDSTKTIRLSHYYTNIQDINTSHLAVDYNPPHPSPFPYSFDEFRLILFRGKKRFIEDSGGGGGGEENPWDTKLTANLNSFGIPAKGSGGITYYEILSGVKGENLDREVDKGGLGFDNLRTHTYSSSPKYYAESNNQHYYPDLVLQGTTSDSIKITAHISKRFTADKHIVKFWTYKVFNNTGWRIESTTPSGADTTLTYTFDIPGGVSPGAYAIGVSIEYATSGSYRSWKSYSFHIW